MGYEQSKVKGLQVVEYGVRPKTTTGIASVFDIPGI